LKNPVESPVEIQGENKNFPSFDELIQKGLAGQEKIITEMLNAGISLHYTDTKGKYVEESPDGRITILEKAKSHEC